MVVCGLCLSGSGQRRVVWAVFVWLRTEMSGVGCVCLAQDRDEWCGLLWGTVMNVGFCKTRGVSNCQLVNQDPALGR
jgi:hypothetical protein